MTRGTSGEYFRPKTPAYGGRILTSSPEDERCYWRAERSMNSIRVRTAMPVGPFDRNDVAGSPQAVPAISRCAQGVSSENSFRKAAAVIVPAFLPPTFLMSAMSLLIWFVYSLS